MKKIIITILIVFVMLLSVGCNSAKTQNTNDLQNEIKRLEEIVDLLSKINELEKEISVLERNKADRKIIESLEQELLTLRTYIQKIDVRTRLFPEWDSYTVFFSIKDLNYLMEADYEKFVNDYHNHIIMVAGDCIKSETDNDGFEIVTFESRGSQVKIKTCYKNGETLSILGKWTQMEFLFTLENGFTLGIFDYFYWPFPEHYFKFINIPNPQDIHYGTINEAIKSKQEQIYLEISNARFGEYFVEENNLKDYFNLIEFDFNTKKIIITLENNILTQEMFLKTLEVFFPVYSDSPLIIRT